MLLRAIILLVCFVSLSVAATMHFGQDILIALGLILTQTKLIAKKLAALELPIVLAWLKTQAGMFFRIELLKKWIMTSIVPLVVGNTLLRRIAVFTGQYRTAIKMRHARLLEWYGGLNIVEKCVIALVILCATIAVSVSSLGLWLILFSVKLPLWIVAAEMVFKAVAFFKLGWLWRGLEKLLPASWLKRKHRFEFRMARAIIKRRRLTLKQLSDRKDSLPFRLGLLLEYLRGPTNSSDDRNDPRG